MAGTESKPIMMLGGVMTSRQFLSRWRRHGRHCLRVGEVGTASLVRSVSDMVNRLPSRAQRAWALHIVWDSLNAWHNLHKFMQAQIALAVIRSSIESPHFTRLIKAPMSSTGIYITYSSPSGLTILQQHALTLAKANASLLPLPVGRLGTIRFSA